LPRHGDERYSRSARSTRRSCNRVHQIIHDVCLQHLPVVFCMDRVAFWRRWTTHHGLFDISYLRSVPNIIHMVPKDEDELADMMYTALLHDGRRRYGIPVEPGPE